MRELLVIAAIFTLSAGAALAQETPSPAPLDPTAVLNLEPPAEPAPPPEDVLLLTEIRDLLKSRPAV